MNKIYILLLSSFSFFLKAQYTLTLGSMLAPGDIAPESLVCSNPTVTFGTSGTGQIWNYQNLTVNWSSPNAYTCIPMSSVSNSSLFPTGTMGSSNWPGESVVYENSTSSSKYIGIASSIVSNCIVFSDPEICFTFPFTYGSSFTDTYAYSLPGSNTTGTITGWGDGTGTLQLPGMTHLNVLKVRYTYTETTTGTNASVMNQVRDYFYNSTSKSPLLSVYTMTYVSSTMNSTSFGTAIHPYAFMAIPENDDVNSLNIFPNPIANGELYITQGNNVPLAEIEIKNIFGQTIRNVSVDDINNADVKKIDVSMLGKGIYFLSIRTEQCITTRKILIQ